MSESYFLFLFFITLISLISCEKLIFVATHFRHGAREPVELDNNFLDPLKEKWTNPGELVPSGERMHYILGLRNRLRYITKKYHLLSEQFNPHEILAYSTPLNRTIMSMAAQLQGLYSPYNTVPKNLTEGQIKLAIPQVDIQEKEIQEEITKLGSYSLPMGMSIIPIHMIPLSEKKVRVIQFDKCQAKVSEEENKNIEELEILKSEINYFNDKYGTILNNFYGHSVDYKYDFWFMYNFCDCLYVDLVSDRSLTEIKKVILDFGLLKTDCDRIRELNLREHLAGDKERNVAKLESSLMLLEILMYMKSRIDIDINGDNEDSQFQDYSKPKMFLLSSHDTSLAAHEVFLIDTFNLNMSLFRNPNYCEQLALEVIENDQTESGKNNYKDYIVNYYVDDELIHSVNFEEFKEKIEKNAWDTEKVNKYCGINDSRTNDNNNKNLNIVFISVLSLLVIAVIILSSIICVLSTKLKQKNNRQTLTQIPTDYDLYETD